MKLSRLQFFLPVAVAAFLPATQAWANNITVKNPSFETLGSLSQSCGTGCSFDFASIPDWTTPVMAGQFHPGNPDSTTYFNYLPDGTIVGFNAGGFGLDQTVSAKVVDGVTYTLTVQVGHRNDATSFDPNLGLQIGGSDYVKATGTDPGAGNWGTYTATFTGDGQTAGDTITIELFDDGFQGDFDSVSLVDNSVVPEPGTLSLLALGMSGMSATGLFKRKKSSL